MEDMMNILVVDDSALMRGLVRRAIATFGTLDGLQILEADNGKVALETLASTKIELVLLDWNMPVLDGLGFLKALRARGRRSARGRLLHHRERTLPHPGGDRRRSGRVHHEAVRPRHHRDEVRPGRVDLKRHA
jgi:CheY-like chemotaxis protein